MKTKKMRYENTYSIHDVIRTIRNKESYTSKAGIVGDYKLMDIIIDSESAIAQAGLTDKQTQAIDLHWGKDLTLQEVGKRLGISHQAVADSIKQSEVKIQKILDKWGNN